MSSDDNDHQGVVWAVLIGVILLAVSLAIGMGLYRTGQGAAGSAGAATAVAAGPGAGGTAASADGAAAAPAAATSDAAPGSTAAAAATDGASVRVDDGVVKFYFASGSAELAAGAQEALADIVKGVAAGQTAVISGYHDTTGDPARNEELAKQRAFAVRDALRALGIGEDKLELEKPAVTTDAGHTAEARRVEVSLK